MGNRYVVEVNGVAYRDTREVTDLNSPTASIQGVVETNPVLATLISVESGGTFNSFTNLSNEYLDIKITDWPRSSSSARCKARHPGKRLRQPWPSLPHLPG